MDADSANEPDLSEGAAGGRAANPGRLRSISLILTPILVVRWWQVPRTNIAGARPSHLFACVTAFRMEGDLCVLLVLLVVRRRQLTSNNETSAFPHHGSLRLPCWCRISEADSG